MFTINALQLFGLITGPAIIGALLGFFAAAILAAGGRCDDEEGEWWGGKR